MAQSLQPQDIKNQCKSTHEPTRMITYDCGPEPQETYLVCDECFKDEAWSRFAVKVVELRR